MQQIYRIFLGYPLNIYFFLDIFQLSTLLFYHTKIGNHIINFVASLDEEPLTISGSSSWHKNIATNYHKAFSTFIITIKLFYFLTDASIDKYAIAYEQWLDIA